MWRNKDESNNTRQYPYRDIIEHEQMTAMENDLRKIVDEMMRAELVLLQVRHIKSSLGSQANFLNDLKRSLKVSIPL